MVEPECLGPARARDLCGVRRGPGRGLGDGGQRGPHPVPPHRASARGRGGRGHADAQRRRREPEAHRGRAVRVHARELGPPLRGGRAARQEPRHADLGHVPRHERQHPAGVVHHVLRHRGRVPRADGVAPLRAAAPRRGRAERRGRGRGLWRGAVPRLPRALCRPPRRPHRPDDDRRHRGAAHDRAVGAHVPRDPVLRVASGERHHDVLREARDRHRGGLRAALPLRRGAGRQAGHPVLGGPRGSRRPRADDGPGGHRLRDRRRGLPHHRGHPRRLAHRAGRARQMALADGGGDQPAQCRLPRPRGHAAGELPVGQRSPSPSNSSATASASRPSSWC